MTNIIASLRRFFARPRTIKVTVSRRSGPRRIYIGDEAYLSIPFNDFEGAGVHEDLTYYASNHQMPGAFGLTLVRIKTGILNSVTYKAANGTELVFCLESFKEHFPVPPSALFVREVWK